MVRHFGVFQWKEEVTQEAIDECWNKFDTMIDHIPGIVSIEHGPYESDEGLNDGFTDGFIMTFQSAAHRDEYLPHPYHEVVKALIVPKLERVIVFDFAVST